MGRRSWLILGVVLVLITVATLGGLLSRRDAVRLVHDTAQASTATHVLDDRRVARGVFGNVCGGQVSVSMTQLHGGEAGRALWSSPTLDSPPEEFTDCTVLLDIRHWEADVLCAVVVHEYGHLAGRAHSSNPRSIMYPRITSSNIPLRCG